jgi:hypothetical protein
MLKVLNGAVDTENEAIINFGPVWFVLQNGTKIGPKNERCKISGLRTRAFSHAKANIKRLEVFLVK